MGSILPARTTAEKFNNAACTFNGHFGFVFEKYLHREITSLRTQTYFRLSLSSVCESGPENDFCDVGILGQSQFSSNNPRTTARLCARYSLRGAREFHSIMESDWPRRNKSHYVTEIVFWLGFADIFRRNQVTAGNTSAIAG